ncbi:hypothetical protein QR680_014761 [Steinernema hermaphroditum]|uniref:Uncharacterized protein n=1 Tax=Steinernema hermaphroditum TaxID=289476 RepID=A0AA39ICN7_9BILA|nr:hypothetical protein QR680_014761 [Steinernema hermaphroditum]
MAPRLLHHTLLCCILIVLFCCTVSAEDSPIRAKRYEYHVSMPFSSVRIQGANPLVEWIRMFGKITDNFKYFG